jgi:hypothetical protein
MLAGGGKRAQGGKGAHGGGSRLMFLEKDLAMRLNYPWFSGGSEL